MKKATILLRSGQWYDRNAMKADAYLVEKVTNTTNYTPGDMLTKAEVTSLCAHSSFDITIIGPERR